MQETISNSLQTNVSELTQKLDNLEKGLLRSEEATENIWPFLLATAGVQGERIRLMEMCPLLSNQDLIREAIALDGNKVMTSCQVSTDDD